MQFYQTRSQAVVLYNTLPAACIEKAVCMKTKEELHLKALLTPRMPRVVLKSNSQYGPQDPQSQEARSSWEPSSDSNSYGETCSNIVDHRISWSTSFRSRAAEFITREQSQKVDREVREPPAQGILPSGFEPDQQVQRTVEGFNRRHEQHRNLRNFAKILPNSSVLTAMLFWEIGIVCCSSGRNMKSTWSPTEFVTSPQSMDM